MPNVHEKSESKQSEPRGQERRRWRRFVLDDARGTLTWLEGGRFARCSAIVSDISSGGLALRVSRAPAAVEQLWLEFDSLSAMMPPWELQLVGPPKKQSGQFLVALEFAHGVKIDAVLDQHYAGRMWQRYPTKDVPVTLSWTDTDGEASIVCAITNISGGGAALLLSENQAPPLDRDMLLELEDASHGIEPVEARVVAISTDDSGVTIARLWFTQPCPLEWFTITRKESELGS